jgi:hypothetical protein
MPGSRPNIGAVKSRNENAEATGISHKALQAPRFVRIARRIWSEEPINNARATGINASFVERQAPIPRPLRNSFVRSGVRPFSRLFQKRAMVGIPRATRKELEPKTLKYRKKGGHATIEASASVDIPIGACLGNMYTNAHREAAVNKDTTK